MTLGLVAGAYADDRSAPGTSPGTTESGGAPESGKLNEAEAGLGRRYHQFERTLLQMAEYLRKTEPERADLLLRAIRKSKEDRVGLQMEQIIELLKGDQFGDAIGREEHLVTNLKGLLELLQSEDRRHQLEEEKKWYESLKNEVGKLSAREKDLRRATEGKRGPARLAERQGEIGGDAKSLVEKIDKKDAERNAADRKSASEKGAKQRDKKEGTEKSGSGSDSDPKKQEGEKSSGKKSDGQSGKQPKNDARNKEQDQKNGSKQEESKKGESGKNGPGEKGSKQDGSQNPKSQGQQKKGQKRAGSQGKQEGAPQQSPPGDSPQGEQNEEPQEQRQERKTPGRDEIEQARRAMQEAEEELKRLQADKALEHQDEAIRKLAEAKERLEKILRQLREEEQEIMLTSLEARFAKMLLAEIQIHVDTVTLSKTDKNAWSAKHFGKSRELSVQQDEIGVEATKALTLLKEEGSSVAFPQGVEQVREDMQSIAGWLGKNDVGTFTQQVEKDVIESLEELVAALQKEIEDRKKPESQRQRGQRGQRGQQDEHRLVEQLAELKMLRSLQLRVNRRTKEIGRRIKGEQSSTDELTAQLQALARRQAEIQEATYILASGRNQ